MAEVQMGMDMRMREKTRVEQLSHSQIVSQSSSQSLIVLHVFRL